MPPKTFRKYAPKKKAYLDKKIDKKINEKIKNKDKKEARLYKPLAVSNQLISATGFGPVNINTIDAGVDDNDRLGNRIHILKVQFKGHIALPTTTTVADMNDIIRFILVKDKQANGANPGGGIQAILEDISVDSFYNEDQIPNGKAGRFQVLVDKTYTINSNPGFNGTNPVSGSVRRPFFIQKNLNIPIQFSSGTTSGALGNIPSNNLYWWAISLQGVAKMTFDTRVYFQSDDGM